MRSGERFRFQSAVGAAQLCKGDTMAHCGSRLDHRPDVLRVKMVKQFPESQRLATLSALASWIGSKPRLRKQLCGPTARLIGC